MLKLSLILFCSLTISGCTGIEEQSAAPEAPADPVAAPGPEAPPDDLAGFGVETEDDYRRVRADLDRQLDGAIGDAAAETAAACRVVAVGAKACGGPAGHRVFSAEAGDPAQVEALAASITRLDELANAAFELASTCDMAIAPEPTLAAGRCTAG